jgi:hypothetical protein
MHEHIDTDNAVRDGLGQSNPSADDEKVVNGLGQSNPSSETIRLGQAAMTRLARSWDDWMLVAAALDVGRTEAMRTAHTNQPVGKRYEREMARWLSANGFALIDKGDRSRLLDCLEHRDKIERWRAGLTSNQRAKLNHPSAVLRKWRKSIAATVPDAEPKRLSPHAKNKEIIIGLEEENHRLRREVERGGGDLFSLEDTNRDVAKVLVAKFGPARWQKVVREAAKLIKEAAVQP